MSEQPTKAFRLSLLNLLLIIATVASLCGIYSINDQRRIAELRAETERAEANRLRKELGLLALENPERAYAVEVESDDTVANQKKWRYRFHLPELPDGAIYQLNLVSGSIPGNGLFPDLLTANTNSAGHAIDPGSYTLDLTVLEPTEDSDSWRLAYRVLGGDQANRRPKGVIQLHHRMEPEWIIQGPYITTSETAGLGIQKEFDPFKPIAVMRRRKSVPGSTNTDDVESLLVFIEPYAVNAKPKPLTGIEAGEYLRELDDQPRFGE